MEPNLSTYETKEVMALGGNASLSSVRTISKTCRIDAIISRSEFIARYLPGQMLVLRYEYVTPGKSTRVLPTTKTKCDCGRISHFGIKSPIFHEAVRIEGFWIWIVLWIVEHSPSSIISILVAC